MACPGPHCIAEALKRNIANTSATDFVQGRTKKWLDRYPQFKGRLAPGNQGLLDMCSLRLAHLGRATP
ncbi:hypothetical protein MESS2_1000077 [Mesorhizobium metallidurans STM 2683]|uniref:Uncharacterized protein n=1 Tax=Mesorhizobium metallidurans STM 2683 TaxID=1297569 RepID=M5EFV0_9HYPH|nr:hypothetical protein MESS2_1000077 [Mesorhizobium metallidurans STM 2683]